MLIKYVKKNWIIVVLIKIFVILVFNNGFIELGIFNICKLNIFN